MKTFFTLCLASLCIILYGCGSEPTQEVAMTHEDTLRKYYGSVADKVYEIEHSPEHQLDEAIKRAPVIVKTAYIRKDEYGGADIVISVRNKTNKKVNGIKVSWALYDNFNSKIETKEGISQSVLPSKSSDSYSWPLYSTRATRAKAYVYSVHFTDGSGWTAQPDI